MSTLGSGNSCHGALQLHKDWVCVCVGEVGGRSLQYVISVVALARPGPLGFEDFTPLGALQEAPRIFYDTH